MSRRKLTGDSGVCCPQTRPEIKTQKMNTNNAGRNGKRMGIKTIPIENWT
jgi:hypothetical protein